MGDSQVLQVIQPCRFPRSVHQALLGEGQVFPRIPGGCQLIGKIPHVHFPDHSLVVGVQGRHEGVLPESLRIRGRQIHDHAPVTVDPGCPGVGIHRFLFPRRGSHQVSIVGPGTAGCLRAPYALLSPGHFQAVIRVRRVAGLKKVQPDPARGGRPNLEYGAVLPGNRAQVIPVIRPLFPERLAVKNLGRHGGDGVISLNLHHVYPGKVQILPQGDRSGNHLVVQAGKIGHLQGPAGLLLGHLHRVQRFNPHGRIQEILNLVQCRNPGQGHLLLLVQGLPVIVAPVLVPVPGLQVDLRGFPGQLGIPVPVKILRSGSPAAAARLRAVLPDDKADLRYVLRHVQHHLCPVLAGMEQVSPAVGVGKPDPYIAFFIVSAVLDPVEGQLPRSLLPGQGILLFRFRGGNAGTAHQRQRHP